MERRCGENAKQSAACIGWDEINRVVRVMAAKSSSHNQILKLFPVQIYGLKRLALLNKDAKPNLISTGLLNKIGVRARPRKRGIIMKSEDLVNYNGVVQDAPVFFENVTTTMEFLAVEKVSVDLLIRVSELERLQKNLDPGGLFPEFKIRGKEVSVALQPVNSSFDE